MTAAAEPSGERTAQLIEVAFKGNRREFFLWPHDEPPAPGTAVIVEVDRGEDLGRVHATGELARRRKDGTAHGKAAPAALSAVLRVATPEEIVRGAQLREDEENVRRRAIEKVRAQSLDMKVSDTEWQWDRKRLTVFFTAEKRVDFRQLVRQLESLFGTRVQMWHIGVRDEARRLDGIGRCARQFCSAGWLPELRPVKSSVAKDQHLSTLNPAQISGTCGRLMCCLRYEHEFYVQQRKRFPKEGKIITTLAGEEKVVQNDIFREQVTLRSPGGEERIIPLVQLNQELGGEILHATAEFAMPDAEEPEEEETPFIEIQRPVAQAQTGARAGAATPQPSPRQTQPVNKPETGDRPPRVERRPEDPHGTPPGTPPDASPEADAQRRRRRRGRRGGRRGRGDGGAPSSPPNPGS